MKEVKERLKGEYVKANPLELKDEDERLKNKLFKKAISKVKKKEDFHMDSL